LETKQQKEAVIQQALNHFAKYGNLCAEPTQLTVTPTAAENDWVMTPELGKIVKQEVK
jgi:hypothetical protein